jgi:hypothetical protein
VQTNRSIAAQVFGITRVSPAQRWILLFGFLGAALPSCSSETDRVDPPGSGGVGAEPATGGAALGGGGTGMGGFATGGVAMGGALTGGTGMGGFATGGMATGGNPMGGTPTGGMPPMGGTPTGGLPPTGGNTMGGTPTGGLPPTGGNGVGGDATGGAPVGGGPTGGTADGGGPTGGGPTGGAPPTGGTSGTPGPCDIYAAASTPCVAAYSMGRSLSSTYSGPLYQVRKGGTMTTDGSGSNQKTGVRSGGTTQDIGQVGGFADAAAQDAFCAGQTCTVSILYDQSGKGNDLRVAPAGCYDDGSSNLDDFESDATRHPYSLGGHQVYALSTESREGYRNNDPADFPEDAEAQGIYMVADGTNYGSACCWDFGNASKDNCYGRTGIMDALFLGTGYWGRGTGNGPWFMADFEGGVWAGGSGQSSATNNNLPSSNHDYAFGILKATSSNYAIRVGDARSGALTTAYDGATPKSILHNGAIILGIGGDNSNHSKGTFYEGIVTAGRPDDATDEAVLQNVQAAGYGQ